MRDIRLENGDVFVDATGGSVLLSEEESAVQRALILAGSHRGSFVYDRSLGSDYLPEMDEMQAESVINEAFAEDENMYIRVSESGGTLRIVIPTKDGTVQREVHFYG